MRFIPVCLIATSSLVLAITPPQVSFSDVDWHIKPNDQTSITVASSQIKSCPVGLCIKTPKISITFSDNSFDLTAQTANIDQSYNVLLAKKIHMTIDPKVTIKADQAMMNSQKKTIYLQKVTITKSHFKLDSPRAELHAKSHSIKVTGPWRATWQE